MDMVKVKTFGEFKVIQYQLGKGTTGRVLLGQWMTQPKQYVAVKEINIKQIENDDNKKKQITNEINNLSKLSSPYIVKLYGSVQTNNHLYMFLEYCGDGDLKRYIEKKHGQLTEAEAIVFFRHIVEGFTILYKNSIIHRDIKPANILLKQNTAKISDFGFSRVHDKIDESQLMTLLGTPLYTAPEILLGRDANNSGTKFQAKCDVWSLGIVLYEMLYGKTPWTGTNLDQLRKNIFNNPLQFPMPQRSQLVKQLLKGMLKIDPKQRLGWKEIFMHPIVTEQMAITPPPQASYEKVIEIFQAYLKQNVVAGYLNINVQAVQAVEESCNLMYGPDLEFRQVAAIRKKMLEMFIRIIHDRNIAFFYSYMLSLLYRFRERLPKKFNANNELEFVLAKIAIQYIDAIERKYLLNFRIENLPDTTVEDWSMFRQTSEYKSITEMIRNDHNILQELLRVIKIKIKDSYIDNKGGERIARFFDKMEGEYWRKIIQAVLSENLAIITKEKNPSKVALLMRDYIKMSGSPGNTFSSVAFDFHQFYEKNEATHGLI